MADTLTNNVPPSARMGSLGEGVSTTCCRSEWPSRFSHAQEHRHAPSLPHELSAAGLVLLQNHGGLLPLARGVKLTVVGDACKDAMIYSAGGSGHVSGKIQVRLVQRLHAHSTENRWDGVETRCYRSFRGV